MAEIHMTGAGWAFLAITWGANVIAIVGCVYALANARPKTVSEEDDTDN